MTDPVPAAVEPAGNFRFAQMLPTLVFDVALPIGAYALLTGLGVSTLWAVVAGGIFPAANIVRVWIGSRRLEPLAAIVLTFLAVGTAISLVSGSVFVALVKESVLTATFGLICLGSLLAERPLLFYIVRQFVAGDNAARLAWWNGLWQYPDFRAAQRRVTAVWGVVYLSEALLRVAAALAFPPAAVVVLSPLMVFGVLLVLVAWTRRHLVAVRERRLSAQAQRAS